MGKKTELRSLSRTKADGAIAAILSLQKLKETEPYKVKHPQHTRD